MFGLCRLYLRVYKDSIISTIVDKVLNRCKYKVYKDSIISTIVDTIVD